MSFQQTTFLGASILNFNGSQAFNGGQTTLNVSLAEDDVNGDSFNPVRVGQPTYFSFGQFTFNGILQNYSAKAGIGGNPIFEVVLTDPGEIVQSIMIITGGYSGAASIVNLYNPYGSLEATGFGNADSNDSGMRWQPLVAELISLVNSNPISFRSYSYYLDLSALPAVPSDLRLGGSGNITLAELVDEICSTGAHDYYWVLDAGGIIRLVTIDRSFQPSFGAITNFIISTDGAEQKGIGRDFRNETTSKFLVGGQVERIWYVQGPDLENTVGSENAATIWPFWGFDINGNAIIAKDINDAHNFKLDARFLDMVEVGDEYHTDVAEIRAILESIDAWQSFLWLNNDVAGPHLGKASKLQVISNGTREISAVLGGASVDEIRELSSITLTAPRGGDLNSDNSIPREEKLQRLYETLRAFAEDHYGKKFMCRLPNIYVKRVDGVNNLVYSDEPTDSGFLDESEWATAVQNEILPLEVDRLLDSENKIVAYVRFSNYQDLDGSQFGPEDYIIFGNHVFIKCTVEPYIVFRDVANFQDPRAIITLPAPVTTKDDGKQIGNLLLEFLTDILVNKGLTEDESKGLVDAMYRRAGGESVLISRAPDAHIPNLAAIPLKSNILTYGPWTAVGTDGKTEYSQDTSLVPWNYGGWTEMNAAGNAKVVSALSNNQEEESGSVSVPGEPTINMGQQLVGGGPYITDINVSIDPSQGVVTTYSMKTWSPRLDKLGQLQAERIRKGGKLLQEQRKASRQIARIARQRRESRRAGKRSGSRPTGRKPESSATLIHGEVITEGGNVKHNVVFCPSHDLRGKIGNDNWDRKAIMSIDGLLRPFGMGAGSGYSNLESPTDNATSPTSTDLNPFKSGHDISILTQGGTPPSGGCVVNGDFSDIVRAFALRGPLMITGWGYDTAGKPVPNLNSSGTPSNEFASGYLTDPSLWKTGPLDSRWDDDRKVWVANGNGLQLATAEGCSGTISGTSDFTEYSRLIIGRGLSLDSRFNPDESGLAQFINESGISRLEANIKVFDGGVTNTGNIVNGNPYYNLYFGNGLLASPNGECDVAIGLRPPTPSGLDGNPSGCYVGGTYNLLTGVSCSGGNLIVDSVSLTFDGYGRLTCASY